MKWSLFSAAVFRLSENGPWVLTEDLEVCDERSAHLPVRVPADDDNPFCMVGGGEMNLRAGIELIYKYGPTMVVCAYGGRSQYLESIGAPSESEVMSRELRYQIQYDLEISSWRPSLPSIVVWKRTRQLPVPSNTRQELLNIFDLAIEYEMTRVAIVTVGVHVPRAATYVAKHLSVYEKYRGLSPVVLESEEVLLAANREKYGPRVEALRNSKSFARNWGGKNREVDGISKIVRDVYGDAVKPLVEAKTASA
ncbi:MAG: YdcF family protein [Candidatus Taylorbacteria bacterium]|nr:YdcF family protein [Candidatus Taylorbacteria bacterium]